MEQVGTLILLFSLTGGYAFVHLCHRTRFRSESREWEQNLFESACIGLVLFIVVRIVVVPTIKRFLPGVAALWFTENALVGFPFVGTFILGLAIAALVAAAYNRFWCEKEESIEIAIRDYGSEFLQLLHRAARERLPIFLGLESRKVYVGYIPSPPTLRDTHAMVLPIVSGHRDAETLSFKIDLRYYPVYKSLAERRARGETNLVPLEHFHIVIPMNQISVAHIFDDNTFEDYFENPKQPTDPPHAPPA